MRADWVATGSLKLRSRGKVRQGVGIVFLRGSFSKIPDVLNHAVLPLGEAVLPGFLEGGLVGPAALADAVAGDDRSGPVAAMPAVNDDGRGLAFY